MTSIVSKIVIDSEYGPQIIIDQPMAAGGSGTPSWVMDLLKPQITVITPFGNKVIAPWGTPGPTRWPEIKIALLVIAAVAAGVVIMRI